MKLDIIEAGSDLGVNVQGAEKGPSKITKDLKGFNIFKVEKANNTLKEYDWTNRKKNLRAVNEFNSRLYDQVTKTTEAGRLPVTLGGDHSIAIASALASINKHKNLGIIWFDAHGDFNTFDTTITGNIHGLPLAVITGYEKRELANFHKGNIYQYKNAVIVGARDLDELEVENLKDAGVTVFTTEDVRKYGAKEITKRAIEIACNGTDGMHISFDLDMIDPTEAPGVSVPAVDGVTKEQAYEMLDVVFENKEKVKSFDIVEFNPDRDKEQRTEKIAVTVLNRVCQEL
ncbi:MAG: arginase [Clostridia bacterium]|nr:arginase [Clostridia bacterium]